jgi:hypothetical protein
MSQARPSSENHGRPWGSRSMHRAGFRLKASGLERPVQAATRVHQTFRHWQTARAGVVAFQRMNLAPPLLQPWPRGPQLKPGGFQHPTCHRKPGSEQLVASRKGSCKSHSGLRLEVIGAECCGAHPTPKQGREIPFLRP